MKKKLREFCLNIFAHHEIDSEVTINGNGVCSSEAFTVADALVKMFDIKIASKEVKAAAKKLRKEYGLPDE